MSALQDFFAAFLLPLAIVAAVVLLLVAGVVLARRRQAAQRRPQRRQQAPSEVQAPSPLPALSISSFAPLPPRTPAPRPAPSPDTMADPAPATATLPTAPPAAAAEPTPAVPVSLLVADDSTVARAKLRKLFEAAGYDVDLAVDGEQALALIGSKPYAVLITDLEMPKVDGFQVIAAVQANVDTEDLPIIAITSHEELSARVHDMQGLYGIFRKPWNDRDLLKRVAAVSTLRRQAAGG
jgi:CheY-like chemotaxis protein